MKKTYIVLIVVLALAVIFLAGVRPVQIGGDTHFMTVYGGSMTPAINSGDFIIVKSDADIGVDDVISFYFNGEIVTHRVVEVKTSGFVTQGDANDDPDIALIHRNDVIGKVWVVLPYLGYVAHYTKTIWGLVFLVWIPSAILIALGFRSIFGVLRDRGDDASDDTATPSMSHDYVREGEK